MSDRRRPNVVMIMADDLGYGDLSCMGSEFRTPNLDRLAASGVRFSSWYANAPVCSPSRAALLSGRYPQRTGVTSILPGRRGSVPGLDPGVPTIADVLAGEGYRTGMVGKWHLGTAPEARPDQHGFQQWYGFLAGCVDYYSHIFYWSSHNPVHDLWDNGEETYRNGEYATELFTDRAISMVRDWTTADRETPFFLYLGYNAPHYPMHAPARYLDRFPDLPPDRRVMAAMVSCMDDGIGHLLDELERLGITEDTCVFFMSDNGPSRESRNWLDGREDAYYGSSAGRFRGHKFSLFEGGVRVPAMLSWPGRLRAGRVIDEPLAAMDVFPTLLTQLGVPVDEFDVDGQDVWPVLAGGDLPERDIFWRQGTNLAVRRGRWKLVLEDGEEFLSDLAVDPSERTNRAGEHPDLARELGRAVREWSDSSLA